MLSGYNSNTLRKAFGKMVKAIWDDDDIRSFVRSFVIIIYKTFLMTHLIYWDQLNMRFSGFADFFLFHFFFLIQNHVFMLLAYVHISYTIYVRTINTTTTIRKRKRIVKKGFYNNEIYETRCWNAVIGFNVTPLHE